MAAGQREAESGAAGGQDEGQGEHDRRHQVGAGDLDRGDLPAGQQPPDAALQSLEAARELPHDRKSGQSGAAAQAAQPMAEMTRPMRKIRRWPNRSPSLPHTSISEP